MKKTAKKVVRGIYYGLAGVLLAPFVVLHCVVVLPIVGTMIVPFSTWLWAFEDDDESWWQKWKCCARFVGLLDFT